MGRLSDQILRCMVGACDDTCKYYRDNACENNELMKEVEEKLKLWQHYEDLEEQGGLIVLKPRTDIAKDNFISALVNSDAVCPEDMGFEQEDSDCKHGCRKCWEKYLSGAKLKELEGDHIADVRKMGKE